jgi:hypothetical protein
MLSLFVFLPIDCSSVDSSCDKTGFQRVNQYLWSDRDLWENNDNAFVEYDGGLFISHYLGIKGSYIAQEEGTHVFSVHRYVYSGSSGLPDVEYRSEGQSTTIPSNSGNVWEDGPYTFHPYFRYPIFARYTEQNDKVNSDMTLRIKIPNGDDMVMAGTNGGRACEEAGCDDMSLSRTVWSCRPNAPSATKSHTPTPTTSVAFQPSVLLPHTSLVSTSGSFRHSQLYASGSPPQSATVAESFRLWNSAMRESSAVAFSSRLALSDFFDGTDLLNRSSCPRASDDPLARSGSMIRSEPLAATIRFSASQHPFRSSSDFVQSLALAESSGRTPTLIYGGTDSIVGSDAFLNTEPLRDFLWLAASSGSGVAVPRALGGLAAVAAVLVLGVFIWRRAKGAVTRSPDEEEMAGETEATNPTGSMCSLEDEFCVATQYRPASDCETRLAEGMTEFELGDGFQESFVAF